MKSRNGFTLIELLVVIGILLMLIGMLLPMASKAHRQSQINTQKLDFQTISIGIEAYRADFGSIPGNWGLPGWSNETTAGIANGIAPPQFLSLATALIGPGPLYTQSVNGINEAGDGANGFGFRCAYAIVPSELSQQASAGATTITVKMYGSIYPPYPPNSSPPNTLFISINDPAGGNESGVGVVTWSSSEGIDTGSTIVVTLVTGLQYGHQVGVPVAFKTPTGNLWGPYISPDRFKYIWNAPKFVGQPQLLDRWGGPIQYFTRFGPNSNRNGLPGVVAGALYGISAPPTINGLAFNSNGQSAIWDKNDGSLNKNTAAGIDETLTLTWMLGDDNGDGFIDNGETLHFTGDYVLISAGPDTDSSVIDPNSVDTNTYNALPISRFCNLYGVPTDQWDQTFRASGNVYNFDR